MLTCKKRTILRNCVVSTSYITKEALSLYFRWNLLK